jgi:hypothetical protein
LEFELPPNGGNGASWRRCIDTSCASPDDIQLLSDAPEFSAAAYTAQPRSVVVLARRSHAPDQTPI